MHITFLGYSGKTLLEKLVEERVIQKRGKASAYLYLTRRVDIDNGGIGNLDNRRKG